MNNKILFSREAEEDLFEAYIWYERQKLNLGVEFLLEIEKSTKTLADNPESCRIRFRKKVRAFLVTRFPFLILFIKKEGMIEVISIFHTSKNPRLWKKRL